MLDVIAFDADDTLWHNEVLYTRTEEQFQRLLAPYHQNGRAMEELLATEMQNLRYYGYGIKSFTLSMIETAIRLTGNKVKGTEIQEIIRLAKEMMLAPVELLDHVAEVVAELSQAYKLMIITKGDLFDQERKLARSGLATHFHYVEIVSEKSAEIYRALLAKHQIAPERFLMVGNSLRSDILPVAALGGHAVHVPYHTTWAHETVLVEESSASAYVELEHLGLLPRYVERLGRGGSAA